MTDCTCIKGVFRLYLLIFLFSSLSSASHAQVNKYVGTWATVYQPTSVASAVHVELQIGTPEKDVIYPATLVIKCDSFAASYKLFLVKKTYNQLGISIYKQPINETPF